MSEAAPMHTSPSPTPVHSRPHSPSSMQRHDHNEDEEECEYEAQVDEYDDEAEGDDDEHFAQSPSPSPSPEPRAATAPVAAVPTTPTAAPSAAPSSSDAPAATAATSAAAASPAAAAALSSPAPATAAAATNSAPASATPAASSSAASPAPSSSGGAADPAAAADAAAGPPSAVPAESKKVTHDRSFKIAVKRLLSDARQMENDPPEVPHTPPQPFSGKMGVSGAPMDPSAPFVWRCSVFGPSDTEWEGGVFQLQMQFGVDYPQKPPTVKFTSTMFHPNVFPDGSLCLDIIQDKWSPVYSVSTILTSIQSLLSDPNNASPANPDAAKLLATDKKAYRKKVRACVEKSTL